MNQCEEKSTKGSQIIRMSKSLHIYQDRLTSRCKIISLKVTLGTQSPNCFLLTKNKMIKILKGKQNKMKQEYLQINETRSKIIETLNQNVRLILCLNVYWKQNSSTVIHTQSSSTYILTFKYNLIRFIINKYLHWT